MKRNPFELAKPGCGVFVAVLLIACGNRNDDKSGCYDGCAPGKICVGGACVSPCNSHNDRLKFQACLDSGVCGDGAGERDADQRRV